MCVRVCAHVFVCFSTGQVTAGGISFLTASAYVFIRTFALIFPCLLFIFCVAIVVVVCFIYNVDL